VLFNTGEGLKTVDAVASVAGPTHRIKPSLRAAREAGLLG
jgi:threonine synthase